MAASANIHTFSGVSFTTLHTIFFWSHWLLSHVTVIERGMNTVKMTIINPQKKKKKKSAEPEIETTTLSSQVLDATNWATRAWGPNHLKVLTLPQRSPGFYVFVVEIFWKHIGKRRNCSLRAISPCPYVFSFHLEPFSSSLKLSSAKSFSLEASKNCRLGKD